MSNILLNVKTDYEMLSSLIKIDDLINYALKNDIDTIGVTDSNLFSFIEFYNKCKKNGIKPVVGIDIEYDNKKFILYARNFNGYKTLCKIVSEKNINGLSYEYLINNKDNIICVCFKEDYEFFNKIYEIVYARYYTDSELKEALITTNNVLYMNEVLCFKENDYEYLKYLYMLKDGKTTLDIVNYEFKDNYINLDINGFNKNTNVKFGELFDLKLPKFKVNLPKYKDDSISYLRNLCNKGLIKRLKGNVPLKYKERLNYELSVIEDTGFVDYFLIVYDIVLYAKKNNIYVGPGRGSAVSSLVSYSLGIIDIDPLKYNLLFERFLNPARASMPDIDIDISDVKREKVISYVKEKYGYDKVANIITFSTLLPKQVLRDIGKVLELNSKKIDTLIDILGESKKLEDLINKVEYKDLIKYNKEYVKLLDISMHLEGIKKHPSIHAAGVVIDSNPLTEKVPLFKSGDSLIVGYDKDYIESMGILKIDLLSITNLSFIENVLDEIKKEYGLDLNLNNISIDDKKTLDLFAKGNTIGVFQYESNGMKNLIKKMNINSFDDLVIANAMFRPGPIEMIPEYLKRRNGISKVTYIDKCIEPILKETLGIMVYQEQLLEIFKVMGGYTYSEADIVRVAIKKKDESILEKEKESFIKRSVSLGHNPNVSNSVYNMILKFANYGFNKSHSVAYAFVGYQMGYLKANYPHIFMINLLNKEIGRELKTKEYIDESKLLGLEFKNIDINLSSNKYYKYDNKIIFPFNMIKGISKNVADLIIEERKKGKFKDFIDFSRRCYCKIINRSVLETLILSGAFNSFKENKKTLIENLDSIINYSELYSSVGSEYSILPEIVFYDEYDSSYLLEIEKKLLGFYFSNHPVTKYKANNNISTKNVNAYFNKNVHVVMLIENIKEIKTKKGELMCFLNLSDEYGNIDGVIFPNYYRKINNQLKKLQVVDIFCNVERRLSEYQLVINDIKIIGGGKVEK